MGYTYSQADEFIKKIAPIIQKEAKARGYHVCSAIIAQAICESAAGTSGLARYHNYFGLKCGSAWKGASVNMKTKEEYTVGTLTTIKDNFRAYANMEEGVKGYFDFISTKRYANLKEATTPGEYLTRIKTDGYATSSTYVNTNMNIVMKYDLGRYDTESAPQATVPKYNGEIPLELYPTIKMGAQGLWVVLAQQKLNAKGFNLKVDGIFGNNTKQAVIAFQGMSQLVKDGIIGQKTWRCLV